jgi:hypothetical protein
MLKASNEFIRTYIKVFLGTAPPAELRRQWQECDQEAVTGEIIKQGLAGLVYHHINTCSEGKLPQLEEGLKPAAQMVALQTALYEREGLKITSRLEAEHIPYLVLKGFSLVEGLYINSALRPVSDLDIYIIRSDYAQVRDVLQGLGYQAQMRADFPGTYQEFIEIGESAFTEMHYIRSLGQFHINLDIHWGMDGLWEGSPLKELFPIERYPWMSSLRRTRVGEWEFNALGWEMQFLHIVSHFALHHQFQGVKWFLDIGLMLRALGPELDWDFIRRMAGTADFRKAIGVTLRMVEDEAGIKAEQVPPWQSFWNGKALPGEYAFYRRRLFGAASKRGKYLAFSLLPVKLRDKTRVLGYYLLDSAALPQWRIGDPPAARRWWQPFYMVYRVGQELISSKSRD